MLTEKVIERILSFGYCLVGGDETLIFFAVSKVESTIQNDCNVCAVPNGLVHIAVDMAVGEFFRAKKTFKPDDLQGLDLDFAVKQIQIGDTNTVFAVGSGNLTAEQRLDELITYLTTYGRDQFSAYRRLRW